MSASENAMSTLNQACLLSMNASRPVVPAGDGGPGQSDGAPGGRVRR
jgi:hypothetical protein